MVGAIVVRAVGGQHRQTIGVVPSTNQMVGSRLAGRVGAVGLVRVGFAESRRVSCQAAINLVGADMQKTESLAGLIIQSRPIGPHRFQQLKSADHIGLNEIHGAMDRAVYMRLGGEMQHSTWLVGGQQLADQCGVANIALHKMVSAVTGQGVQVAQIACVGELIKVDQHFIVLRQPSVDKIAADETGTAGHQNGHAGKLSSVIPKTLLRTISRKIFFSGKLKGRSRARRTRSSM